MAARPAQTHDLRQYLHPVLRARVRLTAQITSQASGTRHKPHNRRVQAC
jgi:hypothetical protein